MMRLPARAKHPSCRDTARCAAWTLVAILGLLAVSSAAAAEVTLHLRNGDRLTGTLVSTSSNAVVLATSWNPALTIPAEQIKRRELMTAATNAPAVAAAPAPVAAPVPAKPVGATPAPTAAKPSYWRGDAKVGADMVRGAKDRNVYYGNFSLTYARPYAHQPKEYFRNRLEYRVDYATTDGVESANRMFGSNKTDFDVSERVFLYNFVGLGFDEVRKIDRQYEVGPGVGYRLIRTANVAFTPEAGLNYQRQERSNGDVIEAMQFRLGDEFTWKIHPRITFTQRCTLLSRVDDLGEMQLRFEGNLAFGLVKNLTLNLTGIELYDTRPVPGVTRNEFQLRSSLGLTF
jgi:hypothetical protein